jgi:hypothetical protein
MEKESWGSHAGIVFVVSPVLDDEDLQFRVGFGKTASNDTPGRSTYKYRS